MFVLVREVVVRVERKIVLNFGEHWRWPELGCRPPLSAKQTEAAPLLGNFSE